MPKGVTVWGNTTYCMCIAFSYWCKLDITAARSSFIWKKRDDQTNTNFIFSNLFSSKQLTCFLVTSVTLRWLLWLLLWSCLCCKNVVFYAVTTLLTFTFSSIIFGFCHFIVFLVSFFFFSFWLLIHCLVLMPKLVWHEEFCFFLSSLVSSAIFVFVLLV